MQKPLHELSIVQSNDFIQQTNWAMDKVPLKLFKALIANIDVNYPPKDNTIAANKSDLVKLLDCDATNYTYLKRRIRELVTAVKVEDNEKNEKYVALVSEIIWEKEENEVKVTFHKDVMPYLVDLKQRFLQYSAGNLYQFKSKYGLIFYENLLSRERQYHDGSYYLTIQEIRRLTGTEKLYEDFRNFEKKVLRAGIDDINNAKVEILVTYEKVKKGRNIEQIHFFVRERNSSTESSYHDVRLRGDQLYEDY